MTSPASSYFDPTNDPKHAAYAIHAASIVSQQLRSLIPKYLLCGASTAALATVGAIEVAFLWKTFDSVAGPDLPGDSNSEVIFLSLSGCLVIAGYHILKKVYGQSGPVKMLDAMAKWAIPFYYLGTVGLFIAFMTADVSAFIQDLPDFAGSESAAHWGAEVMQAATESDLPAPIKWFISVAIPYLGIAFAIAAGGLALVSLFVADHLVHTLTTKISEIVAITRRAATFLPAYRSWKRNLDELRTVENQLTVLEQKTPEEINEGIIYHTLDEIQKGKRAFEFWYARLTLFAKPKWLNPFANDPGSEPPDGIDPRLLAYLIKKLSRFTPAIINEIINPAPKLENSDEKSTD